MVGVRRAIALLLLGFYVTQFAMTAWLGPDEFFPAYLGLTLCYTLAFVALAAEWFWARWFAIGVGNFGSLMLLVLLQVGMEPLLAFFGFTHLAIAVLLAGEGMAAHYEYSEATSERWNFQEESLILLRRAVKSAGSTIPILILYALMPRPEFLALLALGVAGIGFVGLVRGKTWSVFALATAGLLVLADFAWGPSPMGCLLVTPDGRWAIAGTLFSAVSGVLLCVPALVFAKPMLRYLRQ